MESAAAKRDQSRKAVLTTLIWKAGELSYQNVIVS